MFLCREAFWSSICDDGLYKENWIELNCFCDCCFNGDTAAQIYFINTTVEVGQFVQQLSRAHSHRSSDLNTKN